MFLALRPGLKLILAELPLFPLARYSGGGLGWGFIFRSANNLCQTPINSPGACFLYDIRTCRLG